MDFTFNSEDRKDYEKFTGSLEVGICWLRLYDPSAFLTSLNLKSCTLKKENFKSLFLK